VFREEDGASPCIFSFFTAYFTLMALIYPPAAFLTYPNLLGVGGSKFQNPVRVKSDYLLCSRLGIAMLGGPLDAALGTAPAFTDDLRAGSDFNVTEARIQPSAVVAGSLAACFYPAAPTAGVLEFFLYETPFNVAAYSQVTIREDGGPKLAKPMYRAAVQWLPLMLPVAVPAYALPAGPYIPTAANSEHVRIGDTTLVVWRQLAGEDFFRGQLYDAAGGTWAVEPPRSLARWVFLTELPPAGAVFRDWRTGFRELVQSGPRANLAAAEEADGYVAAKRRRAVGTSFNTSPSTVPLSSRSTVNPTDNFTAPEMFFNLVTSMGAEVVAAETNANCFMTLGGVPCVRPVIHDPVFSVTPGADIPVFNRHTIMRGLESGLAAMVAEARFLLRPLASGGAMIGAVQPFQYSGESGIKYLYPNRIALSSFVLQQSTSGHPGRSLLPRGAANRPAPFPTAITSLNGNIRADAEGSANYNGVGVPMPLVGGDAPHPGDTGDTPFARPFRNNATPQTAVNSFFQMGVPAALVSVVPVTTHPPLQPFLPGGLVGAGNTVFTVPPQASLSHAPAPGGLNLPPFPGWGVGAGLETRIGAPLPGVPSLRTPAHLPLGIPMPYLLPGFETATYYVAGAGPFIGNDLAVQDATTPCYPVTNRDDVVRSCCHPQGTGIYLMPVDTTGLDITNILRLPFQRYEIRGSTDYTGQNQWMDRPREGYVEVAGVEVGGTAGDATDADWSAFNFRMPRAPQPLPGGGIEPGDVVYGPGNVTTDYRLTRSGFRTLWPGLNAFPPNIDTYGLGLAVIADRRLWTPWTRDTAGPIPFFQNNNSPPWIAVGAPVGGAAAGGAPAAPPAAPPVMPAALLAAINPHRASPSLCIAASPELVQQLGTSATGGAEVLRRILQAWALRRADLLPDVGHVRLNANELAELRSLFTADTAALVRRFPSTVDA